jgi:hypothetical protein
MRLRSARGLAALRAQSSLVVLFVLLSMLLAASSLAAELRIERDSFVIGESVVITANTSGLIYPDLRIEDSVSVYHYSGSLEMPVVFTPGKSGGYRAVLRDLNTPGLEIERRFVVALAAVPSSDQPLDINASPDAGVDGPVSHGDDTNGTPANCTESSADVTVCPAQIPHETENNTAGDLFVPNDTAVANRSEVPESQTSVPEEPALLPLDCLSSEKTVFALGEQVSVQCSTPLPQGAILTQDGPEGPMRYQGELAFPLTFVPRGIGVYTLILRTSEGSTLATSSFSVVENATDEASEEAGAVPRGTTVPPTSATGTLQGDESSADITDAFQLTSKRYVIRDGRGRILNGTLRFIPRTEVGGVVGDLLRALFSAGQGEAAAQPMLQAQEMVLDGNSDLEFVPAGESRIKLVRLNGLRATTIDLGLDLLPGWRPVPQELAQQQKTWSSLYAVDPTLLDVTSVSVTVTATGTELYKCKDWNFIRQACVGEWVKLQDLVPGENYTLTIDPTDPGFGETIPMPQYGWICSAINTPPDTAGYDTVTVQTCKDQDCVNRSTNFQPNETLWIWVNSSLGLLRDNDDATAYLYSGVDTSYSDNLSYTCIAGGVAHTACYTSFQLPEDYAGWYFINSVIYRTGTGNNGRYTLWRTPITVGEEPVDGEALAFYADANRTRPTEIFAPGQQVYVSWTAGTGFSTNTTRSSVNIKDFHYNPERTPDTSGGVFLNSTRITWTNSTGPLLFNFSMPTLTNATGWFWVEPNILQNATDTVFGGDPVFGRMILNGTSTAPNITGLTTNSPYFAPLSVGQMLGWNVTFNESDDTDKHVFYLCRTNGFGWALACSEYLTNSTCTNSGCSYVAPVCGGTASACGMWNSSSVDCSAAGCGFTALFCSGTASACSTWNSSSGNCSMAGCGFTATNCTGTARACSFYNNQSGNCTNAGCSFNSTVYNSTQWKFPTRNTTLNGGGWTPATNAFADDGSVATAASGGLRATNYSGFNLSIPANVTIVSITVRVSTYRAAGGGPANSQVYVKLFNGSSWSSSDDTGNVDATPTNYTLTGPSSLWGLSWTPTTANAIWLNVSVPNTGRTVYLDAVAVNITYLLTPSVCFGTPRTCANLTGNQTQCSASNCTYTASSCAGSPHGCGNWTGDATNCTTMGCSAADACSGTPSACSTWSSNSTNCTYFGCTYVPGCSGTPRSGCWNVTVCANTTFTTASNLTCDTLANRSMSGNYTAYGFVCDARACSDGFAINYSVYNDSTAPSVQLARPYNDPEILNSYTVTFNYLPTDDYNISNCSLYLDLGGWQAYLTNDSVENGENNYFTYTFPGDGTYLWNVRCFDFAGNNAFAVSNWSFIIIGPPIVNLKAPPNDSFTNNPTVNFTFNVSYSSSIDSCTLLIDDTDAEAATPITLGATTGIVHTFSGDGTYLWNVRCDATDGTSSVGDGIYNYSVPRHIRIDTTPPVANLLWPTPDLVVNLSTVNFVYNVSDDGGVANCTLTVDGATAETRFDLANGVNQTVSYILENGVHSWWVGCTDYAGNPSTTDASSFMVNSSTTGGFTFYESNQMPGNATNYGTTMRINLSTAVDGTQNTYDHTQPNGLYAVERAYSTSFQSNGILISANTTVNFSGYFRTPSPVTSGYITWRLAKYSGGTNTTICQYGDNSTGGAPISTRNTWIVLSRTCSSPLQNVRLLANESIELDINIWNNNGANRRFQHYIDNLSSFVAFNFTRLGFLSSNLTVPAISVIAGLNDTFNVTCRFNCSGGTCINVQVYLQRNLTSSWETLPLAGSGAVLLNTSQTNPHSAGDIRNNGSTTTFIVIANQTGANQLRCYATSNYSNTTVTNNITVTVQTAGQPTISLQSPSNNSFSNGQNLSFSYIPSSTKDLLNCSLRLNNILNQTSNVTKDAINVFNVTDIGDGDYRWNVTCIDSNFRNGSSATWHVTVDRGPPTITLNAPHDWDNFTVSNITFNWTTDDTVDTAPRCNLTIDGSIVLSNISSPSGNATARAVGNLMVGGHAWNVTCIDAAGNRNTSDTYHFNITNLLPVVNLTAPQNGTWTNNQTITFWYNVSEPDQPVFNSSANYSAMIVYRNASSATAPYYSSWNGTDWSTGVQMQSGAGGGVSLRFIRLVSSPNIARPREKIAISTQSDDLIDAYVWNGTDWAFSGNLGTVETGFSNNRSFDVAYESASGRAILLASDSSNNAAQDLQMFIWNGTAWGARQTIDDPSSGVNMLVGYVRLVSNPDPQSNELAAVYIDTTNSRARAMLWNGTAWGQWTNVTTTISTTIKEAIGVAYEQQSHHVLAVAGNATNVSYTHWNGTAWNSTGFYDINPSSNQVTGYLTLKPNPFNNDIMVLGADNGYDLSTALWSNHAWSGALRHDNDVDTNVWRPADFDWEQGTSKGLIAWGTTAGSLSYRTYSSGTWGSTSLITMGTGTHNWVVLQRMPTNRSTEVRILGATQELNGTRYPLGSIGWTGSALSGSPLQFSPNQSNTYQHFDLSPDNFAPYANASTLYPLNNCSLFIDGVFNMSNATPVLLEQRNSFIVSDIAEGAHNWSVACLDADGLNTTSASWVIRIDRTGPVINLSAPAHGSNWTVFTLNFTFNATDNLAPNMTCNLTFDGAITSPPDFLANNSRNTTRLISGMGDSWHWWNVTCTDLAGNSNISATWNLSTIAPPVVRLVSPVNVSLNYSNLTLIYNVSENSAVRNCSLSFDGVFNQTNQTAIVNNGLNNFSLPNVSEGPHTWMVSCIDDSNNQGNSSNANITVDLTQPWIILKYPGPGDLLRQNDVWFNFTAYDNLAENLSCNVTRKDLAGTVITNATAHNGSDTLVYNANLSEGMNYWNVTCIDGAGNRNWSTTWNFNVSRLATVLLQYPSSGSWLNLTNITLIYKPQQSSGLANCTLFVNSLLNQTSTWPIANAANNTFNLTGVLAGRYNWSVNCTDNNGGVQNSSTWNFTVDLTRPAITLNAPNDTSTVANNTVVFNYTPNDTQSPYLLCNLSINGTVTGAEANVSAGSAKTAPVLLHGNNASYLWNVTCRDYALNSNTSLTWRVYVLAPPSVTLVSPTANNVTAVNATFIYRPYDPFGLVNCTFLIDDAIVNYSVSVSNNTNNNFTLSSIPTGPHNWTVNCTDADGEYYAPPAQNFTSDSVSPWIDLNSPAPGNVSSNGTLTFNWTAYDDYSPWLTCTLYVDSINRTTQQSQNGYASTKQVPSLSDGLHSWNVSCLDMALNPNSSLTYSFTVNQSPLVSLSNPGPGASTSNGTVRFAYIPSDNDGLRNCSLYINEMYNASNQSRVVNNAVNNITVTLGTGVYNWSVLCYDNGTSTLPGWSETRNLTVNLDRPTVTLNYPNPGDSFPVSWVLFNWTANETFGGNLTCNLTINGSVKTPMNVNSPSGQPTAQNYSGLNDSIQYWNVTCRDPAGNLNTSETRNFTIAEPPSVLLQNPPQNNRTRNTTINFTYTPRDNSGAVAACSLIINGNVNRTVSGIGNNVLNNFTVPGFANGTYVWSVNCTDPMGNMGNSSNRTLTVDLYPPVIVLDSPGDGIATATNVTFNWTAYDAANATNALTCNLTLDAGVNKTLTGTAGVLFAWNVTSIGEGPHWWNVTCVDDLGWSNTSETRNFTVNAAELVLNESWRITFNITNPNENDSINITANISNYGGVPANSFNVSFWDGDPDAGGTAIGSTLLSVGVNTSARASIRWNITAGFHNIYIVADRENIIFENDKTNNKANRTLTILRAFFNSPQNATQTNNQTPRINFTMQDFRGTLLSYTIFVDGSPLGPNGTASDNASVALDLLTLGQGVHRIVVQANDSSRLKNSTQLTIFIDTTPPNGTFLTPNGTYFNTSDPNVTINTTDSFSLNISYVVFVDGSSNASGIAQNATALNVTLTGLLEGYHQLILQSTDNATNTANSTTLTIIIDFTPPSIVLNAPNNTANFSTRAVVLNYTPTDNLDPLLGCNLNLNGVVVQQANVSNASTNQTYTTPANLTEGTHQWNVTCWDGNNNQNQVNNQNTSETRSFGVYIGPNITLLSPPTNNVSNSATQVLLFNVSDETGLSNCSLLLDGSQNATKTTAQLVQNGTNNFTVSGLNNTHTWAVLCFDNSSGLANTTSATRNFTVDLLPPSPSILTINQSWFNTATPTISYNISDNFDTVLNWTFYVDGVVNKNGSANSGTPSSTALNPLTNGTHVLILEAYDDAGNYANSSAITIYIDTVAPIVTLLAPDDQSNVSDTQTQLNFTVSDNMDDVLVCNITLDATIIQVNVSNGTNSSTPVSGLAGGNHYWNATCLDNATNRGTSQTYAFYINLPDLLINAGNITFSNSTPIEGQNLTVNATVYNVGHNAAWNITVQFWLGDPSNGGRQLGANQTVANLGIGSSAVLTLNYTAIIGPNNIYVVLDPPLATNGSIREENESNNRDSNGFLVGLYDIFSGTTNNVLRITNNVSVPVWTWNLTNATGSNIIIADSDSALIFTQLQALGQNRSNVSHFSDFSTLDTKLNSTNLSDSINSTWTSGGAPKMAANLLLFARTVLNVPLVNSSNVSAFLTGILWDMSDGGASYNGTQDVAFITRINMSQQGSRGTYDYEARVPAPLRDYKGATSTVVFYTELR